MTTSHNHKYNSPEEANKLNEMEIEEKSPKLSKCEKISKPKTLILITIGVAVVIIIIVGITIGVVSNSNQVEQETEFQGKITTYKRKPVPGKDDVYDFIPYRKSTEGKERIEFPSFLDQIEYSNDVADDFIKVLKEEAIFEEYTFETPLSNASYFEFRLKRSKGPHPNQIKPKMCKTNPNKIYDNKEDRTGINDKILVLPCPPTSGSDDAKYSTLASFVRGDPEEAKKFFKKAFGLLLATLDDDDIRSVVKHWCFSTGAAGWVQGTIDSNSNSCYTTRIPFL